MAIEFFYGRVEGRKTNRYMQEGYADRQDRMIRTSCAWSFLALAFVVSLSLM